MSESISRVQIRVNLRPMLHGALSAVHEYGSLKKINEAVNHVVREYIDG